MNSKQKLLVGIIAKSALPVLSRMWLRRKRKTLILTAAAVGAVLGTRAAIRRMTRLDLQGKNILITGGSRGLGLVLAREFARHGAQLAICARNADELARARMELCSYGVDVLTVPCDLTDPSQVEDMVCAVQTHFGQIDVLVNNAGVITVGPQEEMTLEDYEDAMDANFWAALYTTLAVVPEMRARGEGRIVNITSIGGKIGVPHLLPYCASKFAMVGFSEGLRAELRKYGITVTTVCPGLMRTGSPRNAMFKGRNRAEYAWFSIGDSLPLTSMSAERAARRIISACRHGEAEVILSIQAKIAIKAHAIFPELTAGILSIANYMLPKPGGIGTARLTGAESRSALSSSWLTILSERAARRNNQVH